MVIVVVWREEDVDCISPVGNKHRDSLAFGDF